jgi:hypothetical protein
MTDDQLLLASAYLDDDLDPAERARAESDPEVMAQVARLGDVRERLRTVDPPEPARRETAITAALADAATTTVVAPTPLRRRRLWLPAAAAAAVIAVAIAGVAIVANRTGGDDSDTALDGAAASTQAAAAEVAPDRATLAAGAAPTTAGGAAAAGATTTTAAATSAKAPAAAPQAGAVVLASPDALAAFAAANPLAQLDTATTPSSCTGGRFVGRAVYERGGTTIPVEVFVQDRDALALDATTCAEVARAALP